MQVEMKLLSFKQITCIIKKIVFIWCPNEYKNNTPQWFHLSCNLFDDFLISIEYWTAQSKRKIIKNNKPHVKLLQKYCQRAYYILSYKYDYIYAKNLSVSKVHLIKNIDYSWLTIKLITLNSSVQWVIFIYMSTHMWNWHYIWLNITNRLSSIVHILVYIFVDANCVIT